MKLLLISNDLELKKQFEKEEYFSEVNISANERSINAYDVVLISDREIPYNDFISSIDSFTGKNVYYMLSSYSSSQVMENIVSICKSKKIEVIPPKMTVNQIREKILKTLFSITKNSKVITLLGADSKVGTTIISQCIAEILASNTNLKIGLFFLNNSLSTQYIKKESNVSIDNLKVKLFSSILTTEDLLDNCIKENNLYILPGINNTLDVRHYHPEHIENLLEIGSKALDIIIVDAGSCNLLNINGGLALPALNCAKYKYLITTQQPSSHQCFNRAKEQILNLLQINTDEFLMIVNKYIENNTLITADSLAKQYNMPLAMHLKNLDFQGWVAEFDNSTLINYDKEYDNKIIELSNLVATQMNVPFVNKEKKKKFLPWR